MLVLVIAWVLRHRAESGLVTGDPTDIRLTYVWPPDNVDIYDASGKKKGETLGQSYSFSQNLYSSNGYTKPMNFVFELPAGTQEIALANFHWISPAGASRYPRCVLDTVPLCGQAGGERFFMRADAPSKRFVGLPAPSRHIWFPLGVWRENKSVDITLRFYSGPRGEAALTFTGPFETGKEYTADGDPQARLTFADSYLFNGQWHTLLSFSWGPSIRPPCDILLYGKDGKRITTRAHAMAFGDSPVHIVLHFIALSDIAFVTVGEKARERVYHDVCISPTGHVPWPIPSSAETQEFLDIVKSLNEAWEDAGIAVFEQHLDGLMSLRGYELDKVEGFLSTYYEKRKTRDMSEAVRAKLLAAADLWSAADDPRIRAQGITLGLAAGPERYYAIALDFLDTDIGRQQPFIFQAMLRQGAMMPPADVPRVRKLIQELPPGESVQFLVWALAKSPAPEATQALLALAHSDRTELWWLALDTKRLKAFFFEKKEYPRELVPRLLAMKALDDEIARPDEASRAEARALLPKVLTLQLEIAREGYSFERLVEDVAAGCDHKTAMDSFAAYMRSLEYSGSVEVVRRMIQYANLWNGTNIAGLGSDLGRPRWQFSELNSMQLAREFLDWYATGRVTPRVPEGYRAKSGDFRIVWRDPSNAATSAIALWIFEDPPKIIGGAQLLSCADSALTWYVQRIEWNQRPAPPMPRFALEYCVKTFVPGSSEPKWGRDKLEFTAQDLPRSVDFPSGWQIVIEPADVPESVLAGTNVFANWWARYGPAPSAAEAKPPAAAR